jgi:hypothetical protein
MIGIAVIAVLVFVDYLVTGGFYTAKFIEMSEQIARGLRR